MADRPQSYAEHAHNPRPTTLATAFAAIAVAIAMLTPIVRLTPALNWLPDPVEWYFRPSPTRTNFTLFPWAGFVFAGAVVGLLVASMRRAEHPMRQQLGFAAASLLLAAAALIGLCEIT